MSILAKNLKVIRKELGCTQSVLAAILKVGFRTFVRYEAGERDAPVAVLVKIARLGNISLEQLLTTEIERNDIVPLEKINKASSSTKVVLVNFKEGQLIFENPFREELITKNYYERKALTLFRKMSSGYQEDCLAQLENIATFGMDIYKAPTDQGSLGKKVLSSKIIFEISGRKPKQRRKPVRKKLDKKSLQEKIDKLRMETRNINKITVR